MIASKPEKLDQTIQAINMQDFDVSDLPVLVPAINQYFDEVDFTYKKLSSLIENDEALSKTIIDLVNSGIYKRPAPINSLDSALMLLGFKMIRNLVFSHKLKSLLNKHDTGLKVSLAKRWVFTLRHAASAMELAKSLYFKKPEEIFLAVIFSDIAAFMLADKYSKKGINVSEKIFYEKADKYKFSYAKKALQSWDFHSSVGQVFESKEDKNILSEFDIVKLAYHHIKGNQCMNELTEFKKLPVSAQLTFGRYKLIFIREKEQTIERIVNSLS